MRVNKQDLGKVLLSVLNDLQLTAGGVATEETLERSWSKIGLRLEDLTVAVEQLVDQGAVVIEKRANAGLCCVVTEAGQKKILASNSAFSLVASPAQRLRRSSERRQSKAARKPSETHSDDRRRKG